MSNSVRGTNLSSLRRRLVGTATAALAAGTCVVSTPAMAQAAPLPTPDSLVSVCSGVSLPPSVVTDILGEVLVPTIDPIETSVNGLIALLTGTPLNLDVEGLLDDAAAGEDITLAVLNQNGTIVGPSDQCDASADSYTLDNPAGIAIGGNQITGLGDPDEQAVAGEIDSIAIGNRATTDATAEESIALGTDAEVGEDADGSVALGSGASATEANSVALGADSVADRGALTGVSVGEVSVGSPGNERQITNVADGTEDTDAVNLGQLNAAVAAGNPLAVLYDDASRQVITLDGAGGTEITNVAPATLSATSTDAVNGSQLYATNQQVAENTQAIEDLQDAIDGGGGGGGGGGDPSPIAYSDPETPTTPNDGTVTNDATLVGADDGPVALHNVAAGDITEGSTDAVNGGQIYDILQDLPDSVTNAVTYDNDDRTSVTLNAGGPAVQVRNVADGTAPTDAVNVRQLEASHDSAVSVANAYTDSQVTILGDQLESLSYDLRRAGRDARAGTSAALAAAGLPQASEPGRSMIAGGVGVYRGRVGFALGGSYRAPNGQSVYKVGVTYDSSKHVGANAGVGFEF